MSTRLRYVAALAAAVGFGCATVAPSAGAATPAVPPVSTGHSIWGWGSPTPQGNDLNAVAFQGAVGYAVGNFGTVLRSTDSGQTWTGLPTTTFDDLKLVQEVNPTTVVAASDCSVVESTDSGQTFTTLPLGLGEPCGTNTIAAIAFSDPQHGYLELADGTLMSTDDGGATLAVKSAPPLGSANAVATGLAFNSPTTGVAVSSGGLIERTTDGGNSWTQVKVASSPINAVTFAGPTQAFAVGDDGEFLSSADGGVTWTTQPLALQGGGSAPDLNSISCADANNCVMGTEQGLVRTSDGGQTAALGSVTALGVAYSTPPTVVAVGGGGSIAISNDGGQTFPTVGSGALPSDSKFNGPLTAGLTRGTAYQAIGSQIAATQDSGASWSLLRVPTSGQVSRVAFASAQVGFALDTNGILYRTTNSGASWSSFAKRHSPRSALAAVSARTLLLVGPKGIFRSTDGGADFRKIPGHVRVGHRAGPTLASLQFDSVLVAGHTVVAWRHKPGTGPVVISTNQGRTWREAPNPPKAAGDRSVALSAGRLWLLQDQGLWETGQNGRHWQAVPSIGQIGLPIADEFSDVSFSSRQDGIIGLTGRGDADGGTVLGAAAFATNVLRTTNGGRSWVPEDVVDQVQQSPISVLAGPIGDIASLTYDTPVDLAGLFTTAQSRPAASATKLTIRFPHRTMTAQALAKAHHKLLLNGHVSPVLFPNEQVAVSYQVNGGKWKAKAARVASGGSFQVRLTNVRTGAGVVAQEPGTSAVAGAGTPVVSFTVRH